MSGYSDEWNDLRGDQTAIRMTLEARLRADGFQVVWKKFSAMWAADHIDYLECLWCGSLAWDDKVHRRRCTEPTLEDIEPPPPLDLTPGV